MKKLFTRIMTAILCLSMLFSLAACGGEGHTHVFDQEKVASQYLKKGATCKDAATYFKSCTCGEMGTDTFKSGAADLNAHDFNNYTCTICGQNEGSTQDLGLEVNAEDTGWIVTGLGDADATDVVIPEKIDGLPVVAIGERAFENTAIKTVKLSKNIKTIGYGAFQNSTLEQAFLNDGLVTICGQAFSSLANFNKIVIPASVTEMESTVFASVNKDATIYCEVAAKPASWSISWNSQCNANIVWGSTGN